MKFPYISYVPYVLAVILLVGMLWYRGEAIDAGAARAVAEGKLETLEGANKDQTAAITRLTELRAADDKLLQDVANQLNQLTANTAKIRGNINTLASQNNEVRTYMSSPIPPKLGGLLNKAVVDNGH